MADDAIGNMYLGQVSPQLFFQLVNAVATSGALDEVACRAGFSQNEIFMLKAVGGNNMELSKRLFSKWRMRMPTMRDVAVVMATDPPIFDALDALRKFDPRLLAGLEPSEPSGELMDFTDEHLPAGVQLEHHQHEHQQQLLMEPVSPEVTSVGPFDTETAAPAESEQQQVHPAAAEPAAGPQQTSPPQLVLKGLTAMSFNADQIVSVSQKDVATGVEVRGNFCRVYHLVVRLHPDCSTAKTAQSLIARFQELRHPSLICLMGTRLQPRSDLNSLSVDLFLPAYTRSLADAMSDQNSARRLTMPVRVGQLGSLMSALCYLHSRQPALTLPSRILRCHMVSLNAFNRPIIVWLEQLQELSGQDGSAVRTDFVQLLDLAVELVTGRLHHQDEQEFTRHRGELLMYFLRCRGPHELVAFENEFDFIDSRLVTSADDDDEDDRQLGAVLHVAQCALVYAYEAAKNSRVAEEMTVRLEQLAISIP